MQFSGFKSISEGIMLTWTIFDFTDLCVRFQFSCFRVSLWMKELGICSLLYAGKTINNWTEAWILDPCVVAAKDGPEKVHPSPAVFLVAFHAASVAHKIGGGFSEGRSMHSFGLGGTFDSDVLPCASILSFASLNPFKAMSSGMLRLFSKTRTFLAVQRTQQIQGRIFSVKPEGGRQTALRNLTIASLKVDSAAM